MAKSRAEAKTRASESLVVERRGAVLTIGIDRPHKRNAIDDATIDALERIVSDIPDGVRAIVLHGFGPNFSAGLDLNGHRRPRHGGGGQPLARLAALLRKDRVRPGAGRRRAQGRGDRRRARTRRRRPYPRLRAFRLLRAAGRPARHLRRRRRLGAAAAADRRRPHGRHDADRPRLSGGGRRCRSASRNIWSAKAKASPRRWRSPRRSPATRR